MIIFQEMEETVLTNHHAMKIRSEDGRQVTGVDISPLIEQSSIWQGYTVFHI